MFRMWKAQIQILQISHTRRNCKSSYIIASVKDQNEPNQKQS
jgi:hypothetical protein